MTLNVWLPPAFAPDPATPAGKLLADQFAQFEAAHPDISIDVRLKQASGSGGLLRSLITTYNAAPSVLPDVIALNRDDLAAAAAAGMITPLDELVPDEMIADYYPFAQSMGRPEGLLVGLPFAADARVLAYRADVYAAPPQTWADVITGTLVLPGAEASGLTLLNEYLALGGPLFDSTGGIVLDSAILADALAAFQALHAAGNLPLSTLAYTDTAASWQVFRERRSTLALTSARRYLSEVSRVENSAMVVAPNSGGTAFALADGWSWAIVNTTAERHVAAAELVLWLTESGRLSSWTLAANVLPPRAAALAGWEPQRVSAYAADVLAHAQLRPPAEALAVVGPPLRRALDDVLNGRATPAAAAAFAAQSIANP